MSEISKGIERLMALDDAQKKLIICIFAKLASVDGHFDQYEKQFIYDVAMNFGFTDMQTDEFLQSIDEEQIVKDVQQIQNRSVALEIVKEICLLSHIDKELSDEETFFIGKIGLAMGIELEKIEEISNWVVDYLTWKEQGEIIFEEA